MTDEFFRNWEPLLPARDLAIGPLLVLAPHPDDEVIGMGGLILGHDEVACPVQTCVVTDGGQGDFGGGGGDDYQALRQRECRAAAKVLGTLEPEFWDFEDGSLAAQLTGGALSRDAELVHKIAAKISAGAFATVALPSPFELHHDHRALALAGLFALESLGDKSPKILAYEVGSLMPSNLLVDITPHVAIKREAIKCYASQLVHHDIIDKVEALDRAHTANIADPAILACEAYVHIDPGQIGIYLSQVEEVLKQTEAMTPKLPYNQPRPSQDPDRSAS